MAKKVLWMSFVVSFTLLFLVSSSFACLCKPESKSSRIKRMKKGADAIFTGTVTSVGQEVGLFGNRMVYKITIVVEDSWRRNSPKEYTIFTAAGCEVFFEAGKKYLVFAKLNEAKALETDLCMGSGLLEVLKKDIKKLGKPVIHADKTNSASP